MISNLQHIYLVNGKNRLKTTTEHNKCCTYIKPMVKIVTSITATIVEAIFKAMFIPIKLTDVGFEADTIPRHPVTKIQAPPHIPPPMFLTISCLNAGLINTPIPRQIHRPPKIV